MISPLRCSNTFSVSLLKRYRRYAAHNHVEAVSKVTLATFLYGYLSENNFIYAILSDSNSLMRRPLENQDCFKSRLLIVFFSIFCFFPLSESRMTRMIRISRKKLLTILI